MPEFFQDSSFIFSQYQNPLNAGLNQILLTLDNIRILEESLYFGDLRNIERIKWV